LLKISESRRREDQTGMGTVVSLVSLVGGVGVSSLAGNLALAMRYALDKRVAIIDLDLQASALSVFLNVEPDRTIMALTEGEKKIDSIQLESALSKLRGASMKLEMSSTDLNKSADTMSADARTAEQRVAAASDNVTTAAGSVEELAASIGEIAEAMTSTIVNSVRSFGKRAGTVFELSR